MAFTFQISLTKWFETDSVGLLKILVTPRITQLLCSRDQEVVQKGRDSNGIYYIFLYFLYFPIKAVQGGSRELFTTPSELEQQAVGQLES